MGYMRHHAIIVTGWDDKEGHLQKAHEYAKEIFSAVSEITDEVINGFRSFLVPPDGSKEGWDESDEGDERRQKFLIYLTDPEIRGWVSWAEVSWTVASWAVATWGRLAVVEFAVREPCAMRKCVWTRNGPARDGVLAILRDHGYDIRRITGAELAENDRDLIAGMPDGASINLVAVTAG